MSNTSFLFAQIHFIWDEEQVTFKNFFNANESFCSQRPSEIILNYNLTSDKDSECVGLSKCSIKDERSIEITYREMLETTVIPQHPIWKHDTFIYTIKNFLEKICDSTQIFSLEKKVYCQINLFDENGVGILDESGVLITGSYKATSMSPFDISKGLDTALKEILQKSLTSF